MKSLEQLQEKSLKANFTEVQQAYFDRLMSELEVISGGLGFAELKAKAEAGEKEALQVMRDYVAKKEQIVEFIETKELVGLSGIEEYDEEFRAGDSVMVVSATYGEPFPAEVVEVESPRSGVILRIEYNNGRVLRVLADQVIKLTDRFEQVGVTKELVNIVAKNSWRGLETGKDYKSNGTGPKIISGSKIVITSFGWSDKYSRVKVLYTVQSPDGSLALRTYRSVEGFKQLFIEK